VGGMNIFKSTKYKNVLVKNKVASKFIGFKISSIFESLDKHKVKVEI
jgi:hypothetical protein